MKKGILGLTCVLSAATCFLFACDKAPDIKDVKWSNAGITAETLTLPELELDSVKNFSGKNGTGIEVVWNNATEENYDALVLECYIKIPANKSLFDEDATLDELKTVQTSYCVFTATYKVSDDQYTCTVTYFKSDVDAADASYKTNQLLLSVEKANIGHVSHEMWESIVNSNKTWFTEDELAILGLVGVAAPQGDIMGKLTPDNGEDWQLAIENTTKTEFDRFAKMLFDDYIKDLGNAVEFEGREFDDEAFYHVYTERVLFDARYEVNGKSIMLMMTYKSAHIVIQVNFWND